MCMWQFSASSDVAATPKTMHQLRESRGTVGAGAVVNADVDVEINPHSDQWHVLLYAIEFDSADEQMA